jgi:AAA15 family ATPase/GTPase
MQDAFITKIHIGKVRHLENIDIALSETMRKHLILTGKNGSGKTSVLEALKYFVALKQRKTAAMSAEAHQQNYIYSFFENSTLSVHGNAHIVDIAFSPNIDNLYNVTFAYLGAKRSELETPTAVKAVDNWGMTIITRDAAKDFYNYIVNLDYQRSGYIVDGNAEKAGRLNEWFDGLNASLREIFNCDDLKLHYERNKLRVEIEIPNRERFALNEMSDGYKALINIYMELIMRFGDETGSVAYDAAGIVMIDEIETHLHVELQKRALPFLTRMFPNVQFIVATHSPLVITSLTDAVVFDLEKRERLENPSYYSYEAVVESFLDADMYSEEMKRRFDRYKELCFKDRTAEENEEFLRTKTELELMSPASKELYNAFRALELKRKEAKNG